MRSYLFILIISFSTVVAQFQEDQQIELSIRLTGFLSEDSTHIEINPISMAYCKNLSTLEFEIELTPVISSEGINGNSSGNVYGFDACHSIHSWEPFWVALNRVSIYEYNSNDGKLYLKTHFYIDYRDDQYGSLSPCTSNDLSVLYDKNGDLKVAPGLTYNYYYISEGDIIRWTDFGNNCSNRSTAGLPDFWENCLVSINTGNHPRLVWGPHPSGATSYKIYKKKSSPNYEFLASTTGLDYLDTTEYIYDGGGNKTYASYYVKAELTSGGLSSASNTVSAAVEDVGQVEKKSVTNNNENEISLSNYPNPFNPETTISYSIANNSIVNITVYDLLGRKITELINEKKEARYL